MEELDYIHCGDDYISDTRLPEENRFIDGRSRAIRIFTSFTSFTELNQTLFASNLRRKCRKFKVKSLIKRNFYLNRIVYNLWNSKLLPPILGACAIGSFVWRYKTLQQFCFIFIT